MGLDLDAFNDITHVDTDPDHSIVERLRFDHALQVPHQLTDIDLWLNYCNDNLYHLDKALRVVLLRTRWTRITKGKMKTALPIVFLQMFGRAATPHDSQVCVMLHRLLVYYCTSYTGASKINKVRFGRVYHFSKFAINNRRPMSLRLRLEEADGKSIQLSEYGAGKDKRGVVGRGNTPHGPLSDDGRGVQK